MAIAIKQYATVSELVGDSLKGEEAEISRGHAFLKFLGEHKHANGKVGTLESVPESLVEEVYSAASKRYFQIHTGAMDVLVTEDGKGGDKTHKATRYEAPGEGEEAPKGKVHSIGVKAACLMESVEEAEPSRKAALVFVRARFSDYKRGALNSLIRQAKKALGLGKKGGGKPDTYRVFTGKQLQMMLDRGKKRTGKDKTVPSKVEILVAKANAEWIRTVFGESSLDPAK